MRDATAPNISNTLHDLDNGEFFERYPVDMNVAIAEALKGKQRRWHLEFDCEGAVFVWDGPANSEREAIALGQKALHWDGRYNIETARLAICLERRA